MVWKVKCRWNICSLSCIKDGFCVWNRFFSHDDIVRTWLCTRTVSLISKHVSWEHCWNSHQLPCHLFAKSDRALKCLPYWMTKWMSLCWLPRLVLVIKVLLWPCWICCCLTSAILGEWVWVCGAATWNLCKLFVRKFNAHDVIWLLSIWNQDEFLIQFGIISSQLELELIVIIYMLVANTVEFRWAKSDGYLFLLKILNAVQPFVTVCFCIGQHSQLGA